MRAGTNVKKRRAAKHPRPDFGELAQVLRVAPTAEQWIAYCRQVVRNGTEWGNAK